MALADSVPGVSGGTIAFLLGFYDKFIGSLDALMSGNMQQKKEAVIFLLKLGIGWIVGFLMAVSVLASIFHTQIYAISSLFMGFILFAIPIVIREEKENMRLNVPSIIALFVGIAVVALITYFNPVAGSGSSVKAGYRFNRLRLYFCDVCDFRNGSAGDQRFHTAADFWAVCSDYLCNQSLDGI